MTEMIGRGERMARRILQKWFPSYFYQPQVPVEALIRDPVNISERLLKSTVDLVMFELPVDQPVGRHYIDRLARYAIHVDDKHHNGSGIAKIDNKIDDLLGEEGIYTIRLRETNCPHLFREVDENKAAQEIKDELTCWDVNPAAP